MKKKYIIKSNDIFNSILNNEKRISNKYFSIYYVNYDNTRKFGIAVGKKVGKAHVRNKLKRQLRNIIDNNIDLFSTSLYYIVIAKKAILDLKYEDMNKELISLIRNGERHE